ncbi:hypothetical protein H2198_009425, partial [Neophaeococcomyces mojaviensis]
MSAKLAASALHKKPEEQDECEGRVPQPVTAEKPCSSRLFSSGAGSRLSRGKQRRKTYSSTHVSGHANAVLGDVVNYHYFQSINDGSLTRVP